jgi:DMSO/TMAO reductase YedYZ molybdopterin-dependent catalytic subunit
MKKIMGSSFEKYRTPEIARMERRLFLKQGLSLGALAMLTGCAITEEESVQTVLSRMSGWNDDVQAWLFNPNRLAPEFPESRITKPFPFNAYYSEEEVIDVDGLKYKLELGGMIKERKSWTLPESAHALPQATRSPPSARKLERDRQLDGVRLRLPTASAPAPPRNASASSASATSRRIVGDRAHPQMQRTFKFAEDPAPKCGFPMKLRMPTKLGQNQAIASIFVSNEYPGGYWEDKGYNWFSGS